MLSFLVTIIIGFFTSLIARAIHFGNYKAGFIFTTIVDIIGALVATYLGRFMGWYADGESAGYIMSVVGTIIVIFIYNNAINKKNTM